MKISTKMFSFCCFGLFALLPVMSFQQVPGTQEAVLDGVNGDKVIRDQQNKIQIVYSTAQKYLLHTKGQINGSFNAVPTFVDWDTQDPAIASDSWGSVGIVYIKHSYQGDGDLMYAYPNPNPGPNGNAWFTNKIFSDASKPSIAMRKGVAHVAFLHEKSVRYLTFPYTSPPFPNGFGGEIIAETTCNKTWFDLPSIGLIHNECKPDVPVVGYTYLSDETYQIGFQCAYLGTKIGPQIRMRDSGSNWPMLYQDVLSVNYPSGLPRLKPISLSLSTYYRGSYIYLAYADILNGQGRTMLAMGIPGNIISHTYDSANAMPMDIVANSHYNGAEMRIAWQDASDSYYRTAKWDLSTPAPQWITPPMKIGASFLFQAPHAIFTEYCGANDGKSIHSFSELQLGTQSDLVYYDNDMDLCDNVPWLILNPCEKKYLVVLQGYDHVTVDIGDFAFIVDQPSGNGMEISDGESRYLVYWEGEPARSSWPTGFELAPGTEVLVKSLDGAPLPEMQTIRVEH